MLRKYVTTHIATNPLCLETCCYGTSHASLIDGVINTYIAYPMGTEHNRRGIAVFSSRPLCVYWDCNVSSVDIINYAVIRNILSMGEKTKSTGEMREGRGGIVSAGARFGEMRRFFEDKTKSTFCAN